MSILNKEPVKRVEQILKTFDPKQSLLVLETSARTAKDAASSLGCEVGAIIKSLLFKTEQNYTCLLYTSPSPRDRQKSRMPSSA